jgi:hypothetical protein
MTSTPFRRRWFQLGLWRIFTLLAIAAIAFVGFHFDWMLKRREFVADRAYMAVNANSAARAPLVLRIFGERGFSDIVVPAEGPTVGQLTEPDWALVRSARRLFSEAKISTRHLTGTAYRGEHENVRVPPE